MNIIKQVKHVLVKDVENISLRYFPTVAKEFQLL